MCFSGVQPKHRSKSRCERERDSTTNGRLILGSFKPQCEEDGNYSSVQCRRSSGFCWCVDSYGNKLVGTELRFKRPNCTKGETHLILHETNTQICTHTKTFFEKYFVVTADNQGLSEETSSAFCNIYRH